jgi:CHASE2 domain-containing sensor protein
MELLTKVLNRRMRNKEFIPSKIIMLIFILLSALLMMIFFAVFIYGYHINNIPIMIGSAMFVIMWQLFLFMYGTSIGEMNTQQEMRYLFKEYFGDIPNDRPIQ